MLHYYLVKEYNVDVTMSHPHCTFTDNPAGQAAEDTISSAIAFLYIGEFFLLVPARVCRVDESHNLKDNCVFHRREVLPQGISIHSL